MDRHREKQASLQKVETRRAELESWSRASDSAKARSAVGNRGGRDIPEAGSNARRGGAANAPREEKQPDQPISNVPDYRRGLGNV